MCIYVERDMRKSSQRDACRRNAAPRVPPAVVRSPPRFARLTRCYAHPNPSRDASPLTTNGASRSRVTRGNKMMMMMMINCRVVVHHSQDGRASTLPPRVLEAPSR